MRSSDQEKITYNALNVLLDSNYRRITELRKTSSSWQNAWKKFSGQKYDASFAESEWKKVEALKINLILDDDLLFPAHLREIPQAPHGIYCLGTLPSSFSKALGVVGTRKGTENGKELAKKFARELAKAKFVIVSGLALGIDAAAHAGCLEANGKTVAVLAHGLDHFYPKQNELLARKILENSGAVISEYPPGAASLPYRFLERNRIVSGLSDGILIIEAPESSGSLATARFALEQNRDVFVIPGPANHPNFTGSHNLIREGAELVTTPEQILQSYGLDDEKVALTADSLNNEERQIFEALESSTLPLTVDKIIEITNLRAQVVNQTLSLLIIKHAIKETENGYSL